MGNNQRGGGALGIVGSAQTGLLLASVAANIGSPSASTPSQRVKNDDHSGLIIVADLTVINGNGTIRPRISLKGPGNTNSGVLWTGLATDGATVGLQAWYLYPLGADNLDAQFGAMVRERISMAVPPEFWLDWIVAAQIVTFSAEAYWLQ